MNATSWKFKVGWQVPISNPRLDMYELDIYFQGQDEALARFGTDTLLLYQMGKFYEVYGRDDIDADQDRVDAFAECCRLADGAQKSTGIPKHRYKVPPRMVGFPVQSIEKYRNLLLNAGWTIIIVSEKSGEGSRPTREITEIVSGATNEDIMGDTYRISAVYTEPIVDTATSRVRYYSVGYASVNTSTGVATVSELTNTKGNIQDYMQRQLLSHNPDEILICDDLQLYEMSMYRTRSVALSKDEKTPNWVIDNLLSQMSQSDKKELNQTKLNYKQRQALRERVGFPTSIRSSECFGALSAVLQVLMQQKREVIQRIHFETIEGGSCVLYGNAMEQLSVFSKKSYSSRQQIVPSSRAQRGSQYDSLYSLMNVCVTSFGSRYLQYTMANPLLDSSIIRYRHESVGHLMKDALYKEIRGRIQGSVDGERVIRRFEVQWKVNPQLVEHLWSFLDMWKPIASLWKCEVDEKEWNQILEHLEERFIRDALSQNRTNRWEHPISPTSQYRVQKSELEDKQEERVNAVCRIIKASTPPASLRMCSNEKDGYTMQFPKSKLKLLQQWQKEPIRDTLNDTYRELREATIKSLTSVGRITHPQWKQDWLDRDILCSKIHRENECYLQQWCPDFWQQYGETLNKIIQWATELDMLCAFAMNASRYGYHCPTLVEREESDVIIEGKCLRHPMIERLQEDVAGYIANDVRITKQESLGMLLYGMNASGKSSYMKSIGLAIILSQMGSWVPCEEMKHAVIHTMFTRISGNDDYLRGKSSFALEVEELNTILRESNHTSIVLGDELCRGTEHVSGTALVGAGIHTLIQKRVPFVFATHLHDIPSLSVVKPWIDSGMLRVSHLRVRRDAGTHVLQYDRTLTEGSGSSMYGIEVAETLGLGQETLEVAHRIREEQLGYHSKQSRYNGRKMIKVCEVCHSRPATETHHIQEQQDANESKIVGGSTRLHSFCNLVGICEDCHMRHHHGTLEIKGWVETSEGMKLKVSECT